MRARGLILALGLALAASAAPSTTLGQPQRGQDPQVAAAAVRDYFEQELPIGWRVRDVQIVQGGQGANVFLDAPFWTYGNMNAEARDVCPGSEAFLWRAVLFVAISVNRRFFGGTGTARCSAVGPRP